MVFMWYGTANGIHVVWDRKWYSCDMELKEHSCDMGLKMASM